MLADSALLYVFGARARRTAGHDVIAHLTANTFSVETALAAAPLPPAARHSAVLDWLLRKSAFILVIPQAGAFFIIDADGDENN